MNTLPSQTPDRVIIQSNNRDESMLLAYEAFSGFSVNGIKLRLQFMAAHMHHDWVMRTEVPLTALPTAAERCLDHVEHSAHPTDLRRMAFFFMSIESNNPPAA